MTHALLCSKEITTTREECRRRQIKKKKQENDVRVDKTKDQTKDETSKSRKLLDDLAPEKNSLPLNMTFVKSQDSKSKVKEGDQKLRLATSNAT